MRTLLKALGVLPDPGRFMFSIDPLTVATAISVGSKLFGSLFGKSDEEKRAEAARALDEERKGAFDLEEGRRLEAARARHADTERSRMSRASAIGQALAGTDFALPADLLQAGGTERAFTDYQREYQPGASAETSRGPGLASRLSDVIGAGADAYAVGLGAPDGAPSDGGQIAAATPGGTPFATPNLDVRYKAPKLI